MNYAQAVCDALDDLDGTPFGRMGEALDKIADMALKASLEKKRMVAALEEICGVESLKDARNIAVTILAES